MARRSLHRHPLGAFVLAAPVACHTPPRAESPAPAVEPAAVATEAAATPLNCIINGDFSQGIAPWGAHLGGTPSAAPPELRIDDGALCTTLHGGDELIVGWPTAGRAELCTLAADTEYALSLHASMSAGVKCIVKVGHQLAPYTGAFVADLPSSAALAPFRAQFKPDHSDDRAGIAIECRAEPGLASADVCIDDVRLEL